MITESTVPVWGTSWRWLLSDDGTDGLGPGEWLDPFELGVWIFPGPVETGRRIRTYDVPDVATEDAIERLLAARLALVVNALLANNVIETGNIDADDVVYNLPVERRALMNVVGNRVLEAVAVAAVGVDATVGTDAVAPCVALLGRVQLVHGQWRVGCIHLSEVDMETVEQAGNSVLRLLQAMADVDPDGNVGPVELYAVGGREDEAGTYRELSRLVGAIQILISQQDTNRLRLAGAVLPANESDHALAVYIDPRGVFYTSDPSSAESGSESGSD